jgi:hypothetical protein
MIIINGKMLAEILASHAAWLLGGGGEMADLRWTDLRWTILRGAILSEADLRGAILRGADLSGADLRGAILSGAILRGAILSEADLSGADLSGADLRGAILSGADLRGATGNGREIMSAQLHKWPLVWTTAPDGAVTLAIGCQSHLLDLWVKSDPRWIAAMDRSATTWWARMREPVLALVMASPAAPWGAWGSENGVVWSDDVSQAPEA